MQVVIISSLELPNLTPMLYRHHTVHLQWEGRAYEEGYDASVSGSCGYRRQRLSFSTLKCPPGAN